MSPFLIRCSFKNYKIYRIKFDSDSSAEVNGVASKELTRTSESGANGNGITPPDTPKRSQSPRAAHLLQKPHSRSSSPVAIPSV